MNAIARQLFFNALERCHPSGLIETQISFNDDSISIRGDDWKIPERQGVFLIGTGKASLAMIDSLQKSLDVDVSNIICITPETDTARKYAVSSSHPVPDEKSLRAAEELINFVEKIPAGALILFAISGGTSSLLCKPAEGLTLSEINKMNQLLLASGATIEDINGVRKHLSAIKGGQLLRHFNEDCTLVELAISDVPSDDMKIIGSGPTTPDDSTFQDVYDTTLRFDLWEKSPDAVCNYIQKGLAGKVPETLKPGDDPLRNHQSYIIGSAEKFARQLARQARQKDVNTWIADRAFDQPVQQVAAMIMEKIQQKNSQNKPLALIFYGESTVEVAGNGKGGRNQELALRGALEIDGMNNITWLSAGTDGIDGPTDAAGAVVDGTVVAKAKEKGLDAGKFLRNNDSYHFHKKVGTLLKTGPTGNNMMDIVLVIIE